MFTLFAVHPIVTTDLAPWRSYEKLGFKSTENFERVWRDPEVNAIGCQFRTCVMSYEWVGSEGLQYYLIACYLRATETGDCKGPN